VGGLVRDRLAGILLFLPVPIVLFLFTQAPLGVGPALFLGVAVMLSHRFYARPAALRARDRRCLWCGAGTLPDAMRLELAEPFGNTTWRACSAAHLEALRRVFAWAEAHGALLRLGILGSLVGFLVLAAGRIVPFADAVALFRFGIATTVLSFAILAPRGAPHHRTPRIPFPAHIQALIGTAAVLWLFRIVGVVWLVLALRRAL